MAYEHEREESRCALRRMTEWDRFLAVEEPRRARGLAGDPSDTYGETDD